MAFRVNGYDTAMPDGEPLSFLVIAGCAIAFILLAFAGLEAAAHRFAPCLYYGEELVPLWPC